MKTKILGLMAVGLLAGPMTANAVYVVSAVETGGAVVFTGSGSLNTEAWRAPGSPTNRVGGLLPSGSDPGLLLGSNAPVPVGDYYYGSNFAGPTSFGMGTSFAYSSSGTGDYVGIAPVYTALFVPFGYISGNPLAGSSTFDASTFASLGLTTGVYVWTWGQDATADSFMLRIGADATDVPEPGTLALFGLGFAGLGFMRRRKA